MMGTVPTADIELPPIKTDMALAPAGETMPIPQPSAAVAMIHMIERAARDPSVDVLKLEKLCALQTQMMLREAEQQFNDSMAAVQAVMTKVSKDSSNPSTKSRYASYVALDNALRPIYSDHGFGLSFDTGEGAPADHVRIVCIVTARGFSRTYHIDMPADGKGAKGGDVMTKTHATGSAVTYGRRYLLTMIFNIAVVDDDGNRAGHKQHTEEGDWRVTAAQVSRLKKMIKDTGSNEAIFLTFMAKASNLEIKTIEDIPSAQFSAAVAALNKKAAANSKKTRR